MAPKKRGRPPQLVEEPKQAPPKRSRPHRTKQTPFEAAADDELFEVEKIVNMKYIKGQKQYLVQWLGYPPADTTWEPVENLVGCARQIRQCLDERDAQDKEQVRTHAF